MKTKARNKNKARNKAAVAKTEAKTSRVDRSPLKIALVHDYLREFGGAERVLAALHELYPEAPVYTAFVDQKALGDHWHRFADWDIRTTWLQKVPGIKKIYSPLRVLAARAFAELDLSEYDLVITSTNAYMAKAVRAKRQLCYCHTPPRSLYGYSTLSDWKKRWWLRLPGELINHYMRMVDFETAHKVDIFIANSRETARRIQKFYRRESTVVYPPVDLGTDQSDRSGQSHKAADVDKHKDMDKDNDKDKNKNKNKNKNKKLDQGYYLYVNRLAFAKHPELAVAACSQLELPLKVVGTGPMLEQLKASAGPTVTFLGSVSDEGLRAAYGGARALLYPVEDEDFGIVPIEAMSHGVPVIAHASGGPLETVLPEKTGFLFTDLTIEGLKTAIQTFSADQKKSPLSSDSIKKRAELFSREHFFEAIQELVREVTR